MLSPVLLTTNPIFLALTCCSSLILVTPLLKLAQDIPWDDFDSQFAKHYSQNTGARSKSIRLMVGLLILKQLEYPSDESVVLQ